MFSSTFRTSRMEIPPISGAPTFLVMPSSSSPMSRGVQAEAGLELGQGGTGADPEFAGAGVGVELFGVAAGQRAEVQRRAVVAAVVALAFLHGFQDEHGVGLVVQAQAGEVREAGVRAEAVVAVVRADLQRTGGNDQAFAFELL